MVVPCYNEAGRLDVAAFTAFVASQSNVRLILVNDGSEDETLAVLHAIQAAVGQRVDVLDLDHNGGKAEAVRRGLLHALATDAEFVGYWDADLATPLAACSEFVELLRDRPSLDMVIGSRVLLLGRVIERRAIRHYAGRVFATAASVTLKLPVYDTQCGAKLFRASPRLANVLERRFLTTWAFDVEIIARSGSSSAGYVPETVRDRIYELPLREWRDVAGSKVRWWDFMRALLDLARIYRAYVRPRGSRHMS
jgi:dolichyl-phosphate beta-glucosyltransferase